MGRGTELNKRMRDERIEIILSTALKLFAVRGLAATKISDIAEEAGMSQGLMYHYYKSKDEIFIEIIDTAFKRLIEACQSLVKMPISAAGKIKTSLERIIENLVVSETSAYYHVLIAQAAVSNSVPDEAKDIIKKQNQKPYKLIAEIMKAGIEEGTIKDFNPKDLAIVYWTTIKGIALHKASHGPKFSAPDPAIIISMFLREEVS